MEKKKQISLYGDLILETEKDKKPVYYLVNEGGSICVSRPNILGFIIREKYINSLK